VKPVRRKTPDRDGQIRIGSDTPVHIQLFRAAELDRKTIGARMNANENQPTRGQIKKNREHKDLGERSQKLLRVNKWEGGVVLGKN